MLAELARRDQRRADGVEEPDDELEALLLRAELEQVLLRFRRQLHLRGELERKLRRPLVDLLWVGARDGGERTERAGGTRCRLGVGPVACIVNGHDGRCEERASSRDPLDAEAGAAFDDDVEPAVVEALEHLGDARERADLAHALLVGIDQPELAVVLEALADQLPVPRLEDVERHALGRQQDDAEREEADLLHRPTGYARTRTMAAWLPIVSNPCCATRSPTRTSSASRTAPAAATTSR